MKRNAEEIKLVKDWLRFAEENLLLAHSGMGEDFSPYYAKYRTGCKAERAFFAEVYTFMRTVPGSSDFFLFCTKKGLLRRGNALLHR